jgi:MFS transporter, YNFM family, putative membrane transport protein
MTKTSLPITLGTPAFRRTTLGMVAGGFATFAALYCVQPLLPSFTQEFALSPAESSVSLAISTATLAVAMLVSSLVSDFFGRRVTMAVSLGLSSLLTFALIAVPDWNSLLVFRALAGLALSGFPAISIAYLADELDRRALGVAVGLTIAGNSIGGMGGRLIVSILVDFTNWRLAIGAVGVICMICALILWATLPEEKHFHRVSPSWSGALNSYLRHLKDPGLLLLFAEAFLLLGCLVTMYNYIGFRLLKPPFALSQTLVGFVFLIYSLGTVSSSLMGPIGNAIGRRTALWASLAVMLTGLLLTIPDQLTFVVLGMALFTFGFFAAHSVASSWVGLRAEHARAQASTLYMLAYYVGSSVAGVLGGTFWVTAGWSGIVAFIGGMSVTALALAFALARMPPPAWLRQS